MRTKPPNFGKRFGSRHNKPIARREKSCTCTSWKRAFSFKTRARRHTSKYSVLLEHFCHNKFQIIIGQANLKLFILRRIFRRNTVGKFYKQTNCGFTIQAVMETLTILYVMTSIIVVIHMNAQIEC